MSVIGNGAAGGPGAPILVAGGGMGAASLPATSGNEIGLVLAYAAIAIGVCAIIGQIAVRLVRRHYALRMK